MRPTEIATSLFDMAQTNNAPFAKDMPEGFQNTLNFMIQGLRAMATAHPMHLNFTSWMRLFSMRREISTVSLSSALLTIDFPEGSATLPTLRGLA